MIHDKLSIDQYQVFVSNKTSKRFPESEHAMLGLISELGEIADAIKREKIYGEDVDDDGSVYEEVGDVLFYLCMLCNAYGFQMSDAMRSNVEKLSKRYKDGFTQEEALARNDKI